MARNFRRHRSSHPIADLNVTNLIDLGFILLIIFMIVAQQVVQHEQTIPVTLPTVAKAPQPPSKDVRHVVISVDAKGLYYLENNPVPITLPQLRSRLSAYAAEPKQPHIRLRGDGDVPYKRIAELVTEATKVGLTSYQLDTQVAP
jgi:biopolymer transport protein TolR